MHSRAGGSSKYLGGRGGHVVPPSTPTPLMEHKGYFLGNTYAKSADQSTPHPNGVFGALEGPEGLEGPLVRRLCIGIAKKM